MSVSGSAFIATTIVLSLRAFAPAVSADHEVHCVDDPVCYAACQAERAILFANNEGDLPACYYDPS